MEESKPFQIKLATFEGPLDLLWSLIKKSKLDITQISLSEITAEYISYINMLKSLDVNIASDFVLMATTLLHYKSQILLPIDNEIADDYDPPLPPELVQQLLEYKKYQDAAYKLEHLAQNTEEFFARPNEQFVFDFEENGQWQEVSLLELISAFAKIAESYNVPLTQAIEVDEITVEESMSFIRDKLNKQQSFVFSELFLNKPTKIELVTTFLAVLELVRQRDIAIRQHQLFGEIRIFQKNIDPT